jgi:hypothetical protein
MMATTHLAMVVVQTVRSKSAVMRLSIHRQFQGRVSSVMMAMAISAMVVARTVHAKFAVTVRLIRTKPAMTVTPLLVMVAEAIVRSKPAVTALSMHHRSNVMMAM